MNLSRKEICARYRNKNKEKILIRQRLWRKNNLKRAREIARNWARKDRKLNPEKYRQLTKEYRIKHKEKYIASIKKYRKKNPEKVKQWQHNSYIRNKEKNYKRNRIWALKNKDKIKKYQKKYYEKIKQELQYLAKRKKWYKLWSIKNKDKLKTNRRIRKARSRNVNESFNSIQRKCVFKAFDNKCIVSGMPNKKHKEKYGFDLTLDHIEPLSKGNPLTFDNVCLLDYKINLQKRDNGIDFYGKKTIKLIKRKQEIAKKLYQKQIILINNT